MLQKMMRLTVFLLFLRCVFCLATGQTHTSYNQMEPRLKSFVDMALNKANQQLQFGHLNFDKIGEVAQVTDQVKIDVRLKRTVCNKVPGNQHTHRPACAFMKLEVRCMVCRLDPNDTSDPFIDCVRRADQKERYAQWDQHCLSPNQPKARLLTGAGMLLRGEDE